MVVQTALLFLLIAAAEVAQGILRLKFLNRRVGDHRARQIGVGTGSVLNFALTWLMLPWLGAGTVAQLLGSGLLLLGLMLAFDLGFGRFVFHAPWERILREFDLRRGGLLAIGMLLLGLSPLLAGWLRGMV